MFEIRQSILPTTFFLGADAKFYALTNDFGTIDENESSIKLISHLLEAIDIEQDFDFDQFDQFNDIVLANKEKGGYNGESVIFILYYLAKYNKAQLIHSFPFPQEELRVIFHQLEIPFDVF